MTKLSINENVTMDAMGKCNALNCIFDDDVEIVPDDK